MIKDIPGYEKLYAVTDDGKVWSHSTSRWLKLQSSDAAGHMIVNLSKHNKTHTWGVQQLVLLTYVGPCPDGLEACHNNNVSSDNNLTNLRYDTHQNNMLESAQQNKDKVVRGERVNTAKLTETDVRSIRRRFNSGESIADLLRDYNFITRTAMHNIVKNNTWKHVTIFNPANAEA